MQIKAPQGPAFRPSRIHESFQETLQILRSVSGAPWSPSLPEGSDLCARRSEAADRRAFKIRLFKRGVGFSNEAAFLNDQLRSARGHCFSSPRLSALTFSICYRLVIFKCVPSALSD